MAKFTEDNFSNWTRPTSDSEEQKLANSERMVREAISSDEKLSKKSTETFGQGSYANDTNVRLNSDIDINVRYTGGFYFSLPDGIGESHVGIDKLPAAGYSFSEFKDDIEMALVRKFGQDSVKRQNKCITVLGNSYRVETDVVPTWNYRRYNTNGTYVLGAKFMSDEYDWIINYPKQHIDNGISKNKRTSKRFKRLTRLHRKLRYKMIEDNIKVNPNITSFLIECLVWNTPDRIFNDYHTWTDRLKQSIIYIYDKTKVESTCTEWGEVSELLYLFRDSRKWNYKEVNQYMQQLWTYLQF